MSIKDEFIKEKEYWQYHTLKNIIRKFLNIKVTQNEYKQKINKIVFGFVKIWELTKVFM